MYEQMKEENVKLGEEICEILRKHREENKSYEEYSKNAERNLTFIKENMKLRNEIKKLKAEIVEREECEKLIMDIWARTNDRDQALPVHYRQKKENGEWDIDDDEESSETEDEENELCEQSKGMFDSSDEESSETEDDHQRPTPNGFISQKKAEEIGNKLLAERNIDPTTHPNHRDSDAPMCEDCTDFIQDISGGGYSCDTCDVIVCAECVNTNTNGSKYMCESCYDKYVPSVYD